MSEKRLSNVIGFDDTPFDRNHRGRVNVVGTVYASLRFDGVLISEVEKDGDDAAASLICAVRQSKFMEHAQLIMLQGITMAGFNVVDVFALSDALSLPVLVVARKQPDFTAIKKALLTHFDGGEMRWRIIETLGPMEPVGAVHVQRVGLTLRQAQKTIRHFSQHGHIPEPLRSAHLIAGALSFGQRRGNP